MTWIKLRDDLADDPKVFRIGKLIAAHADSYVLVREARDLFGNVTQAVTRNALRDVTVGALTRVWAAANRHTQDGTWQGVTLEYIDTLAEIPGFGRAMEAVGWLVWDAASNTVTLPNFTEYNAPAKGEKRSGSTNAERQKRHREKARQRHSAVSAATASLPVTGSETGAEHPSTVTPCNVTRNVTRDVINNALPSYSTSISISVTDPDSESESRATAAGTESPYPALGSRECLAELEAFKTRINALRPAWKSAPHWTHLEESALLEALPNLRHVSADDWERLRRYFLWGHSAANSGKEAHKLTSKRLGLLEQLPAYLDRALTHWKQSGRPALAAKPNTPATAEGSAGTPARSGSGPASGCIDPQEAAALAAHWKSLTSSAVTPAPTPASSEAPTPRAA